ncbi:MAG: cobalt ECF transporter T component CbiQ [Nitrospirota bacterium]|jgi:cobalt/nickel transport system permease protein
MHLEEFAQGHSPLHRLDPRVKVLAGLPPIAAAALASGLRAPAVALLAGVGAALLGRLDARKLGVRLLAANVFILTLWVFLPFSHPGEAVFSLGPLAASREGLLYALSITLKANAAVLLTIALFGTSESLALAHALVHLRAPRKLVYLFFFFSRYLELVHEEYGRLRNAMRIRCFRPRTGAHTYRSYAYLVGMLLVRSAERARRLYGAMLLRGFRGHFPVIDHFHLHGRDLALGGLLLGLALVVALL